MNNKDWKDKRINAINKVVKNKYDHQYYIEEYCNIINSKAKNKKQFKKESVTS
jgi:hypothetical protein